MATVTDDVRRLVMVVQRGNERVEMSYQMYHELHRLIREEADEQWRKQLAAHILASSIT